MTNPHDEAEVMAPSIMYIRGIPFKCPVPAAKQQDNAVEDLLQDSAAASILSKPERTPSFFKLKKQMQQNMQRRATCGFAAQGVPLRVMRDLALQSCLDLGDKSRLVRFTLVESPAVMARITEEASVWFRRSGLLAEKRRASQAERSALFGAAPHVAILYGPTARPEAARLCAETARRFAWFAAGAGLATGDAEELITAAADPAIAALLTVPSGYTVFAALLFGYPRMPALALEKRPATTLLVL